MQELRTQALDLIQRLDDDRLRLVLDFARHLHDDTRAGSHGWNGAGHENALEALLDEPL
jgi:hypothetical protein